jgi:hypothetical protein
MLLLIALKKLCHSSFLNYKITCRQWKDQCQSFVHIYFLHDTYCKYASNLFQISTESWFNSWPMLFETKTHNSSTMRSSKSCFSQQEEWGILFWFGDPQQHFSWVVDEIRATILMCLCIYNYDASGYLEIIPHEMHSYHLCEFHFFVYFLQKYTRNGYVWNKFHCTETLLRQWCHEFCKCTLYGIVYSLSYWHKILLGHLVKVMQCT